jgi:toxin ParE1/3/4
MAHSVVWLPEAIADIDGIAEYLSGDSPSYASALVQRALHTTRRLGDFPLVGAAVPEWDDPAIRQCIVFKYRLIYRVETSVVTILALIHGARLLPEEVRDR